MDEMAEGETVQPKTKAGEFRRRSYELPDGRTHRREKFTRGSWDRERALGLRHRLEATGADVTSNAAAILVDSRPLDVRPELTLRLPLREAHVMAAHRPLATYFTFRHNFTLPDVRRGGVQTEGDQLGRLNISQY